MSVGYSTLYGDTRRRLRGHQGRARRRSSTSSSRHRNERDRREPIPRLDHRRAPPSAELRPDQRDEDSLPPYAVLDPILEAYVEDDLGREQLSLRGFAAPTSTA